MQVFRLERADGTGVYRGGSPGYEAQRAATDDDVEALEVHPVPGRDSGELRSWFNSADYDEYKPYFCGFVSMEQLEQWFPRKNWSAFDAYNERHPGNPIQLVEYDGAREDIKVGDFQCMFYKDRAEQVRIVESFLEFEGA